MPFHRNNALIYQQLQLKMHLGINKNKLMFRMLCLAKCVFILPAFIEIFPISLFFSRKFNARPTVNVQLNSCLRYRVNGNLQRGQGREREKIALKQNVYYNLNGMPL